MGTVKGDNMNNLIEFSETLNITLVDIAQRVAKLELVHTASANMNASDVSSLVSITNGDYSLIFVLSTETSVLQRITRNMKHQESISSEDIHIYTTEFYNIFCGHVVSALNDRIHARARFGIPRLIRGYYNGKGADSTNGLTELDFQCPFGALKLKVLNNNSSSNILSKLNI